MALTKQSMAVFSTNAVDVEFSYRISWADNVSFNYALGGRVGLYYDTEVATKETLFAAVSQAYIAMAGLGHDFVDLIKVTFDSDSMDCGPANNCVRKKISPWAKVLAIAPQSTSIVKVLIMNSNSVLVLLSGDLAASSLTEEQQTTTSMFTTFTVSAEVYDQAALMASAFYTSSGFQDFYIGVTVSKIPEASMTLDDGDLSAILTLVNDRSNGFFDPSTTDTIISDSLTLIAIDTTADSFNIDGSSMLRYDDYLVHFNG